MNLSLSVEVEDIPGRLRRLLSVFEQVNANIISIVHIHAKKIGLYVPLEITFSIPNKNALKKLSMLLKKEDGWRIISLEKTYEFKQLTFGLVGHIIHTKSIEKITNCTNTAGANVLKISMTTPYKKNGESSALLTISAKNDDVLSKAISKIEDMCRQNKLLLIKAIE
ncbi:MAG: hypothetical protein AB1391_01950 [Candidatus Micrarchaeota archaeon]